MTPNPWGELGLHGRYVLQAGGHNILECIHNECNDRQVLRKYKKKVFQIVATPHQPASTKYLVLRFQIFPITTAFCYKCFRVSPPPFLHAEAVVEVQLALPDRPGSGVCVDFVAVAHPVSTETPELRSIPVRMGSEQCPMGLRAEVPGCSIPAMAYLFATHGWFSLCKIGHHIVPIDRPFTVMEHGTPLPTKCGDEQFPPER